ncbi:MAG TPA: DUF6112 family protein [Acidimicrobiales bacterium]|nr:DUF6112 family protein [Acidimicrobiales bacterium]
MIASSAAVHRIVLDGVAAVPASTVPATTGLASTGLASPGSAGAGPTAVGSTGRLVGVSLTPNAGQLPGASQLQTLTNGIGGWALILALVGMVVGAGIWALGAHSQNYQQSFVGRRAVLVSGLAALLIGAAPAVINFFFSTGHAVQP